VPLDSAIVFAPAGDVVPYALEALKPGGTVAVAGIYLSDVPVLNYERHLFHERDLRSVTSNTRRDGEELFRLVARLPVAAHTTVVPFDAVDRPSPMSPTAGPAVPWSRSFRSEPIGSGHR
jgi:propanol-preferring alcohol dehydrogenase